MDCQLQLIDYASTGYFSSLITDFLSEDKKLQSFYQYSPNHPDFLQAIETRKSFLTDRKTLVQELQEQYANIITTDLVSNNISRLQDENTFTICTAHQPNLFTGYLYFVYKILQTVKLSHNLKQQYPQYNFVPVYYMGSEDNDLDELNHITIGGEEIVWNTAQSGAVGRMQPDGIEEIIAKVQYHLGINKNADYIISLLKDAYLGHDDIQSATLFLVNALFGPYGVVVLIADTPAFKKIIAPIIHEELFQQTTCSIVNNTIRQLSQHYHAQANPREINLFYLKNNLRERIVKENDHWKILNTSLAFTKTELEKEIENNPGRFSPNVVLRGILQESILPDVAFIGGGGELAYWLELKKLFEHHKVFYPVLLLRNSFLWVNKKANENLQKLELDASGLFEDIERLIKKYVKQHTPEKLDMNDERKIAQQIFDELQRRATAIDPTLLASVQAAHKKVLHSLDKIELKFLRGEKKKQSIQINQLRTVKTNLFPSNNLQERVENFMPFYVMYGNDFFDTLYKSLEPLCNKFTIITEK